MSAVQKVKNDELVQSRQEWLRTRTEFGAMIGLILVALGLVFLLGEANHLDYGSPWWTLFIGIPGLTFLFAGVMTVRHHGRITGLAWIQFTIGAVAVLLVAIFLFDPEWSFTRGWTLFCGQFWDTFWRWGLVALGGAIAAFSAYRRSLPGLFVGGAIAMVGLVFVLDIDWGRVWPLFIIGAGVLILAGLFLRRR